MSNIDDGGPAFARPMSRFSSEELSHDQDGMTLRDYFAANAMQGLMAGEWGKMCADNLNNHNKATSHTVSQFAYQLADTMLAARKAQPVTVPADPDEDDRHL